MLIPRFFRSFLYASSFFFEVFTITSSEPFANAFLPTLPAFSFSDLMIIFFRFSHPSKAFFPMDLICFPIVISLMVVLSLKALSSMEVTRYFLPVEYKVKPALSYTLKKPPDYGYTPQPDGGFYYDLPKSIFTTPSGSHSLRICKTSS